MPTCDAAWLAAQRWYGAADRRVRSLQLVDAEACGPGLSWQVMEVHFEPPPHERAASHPQEPALYQLFWDERAGEDAAHHPAAMAWLFPDLFGGDGLERTELLGGEQSNTSVVVEPGPVIVKVLRRLSAQPNPDAEVVRRLWEGGFRGVPEPLGERRRRIDVESLRLPPGPPGPRLHGSPEDEAPGSGEIDLAVARRFLPGSTDGWRLAVQADSGFAPTAAELGGLTAELHLALAEVLGVHPVEGTAVAAAMLAQSRRVLGDVAPAAVFERLADGGEAPAIRAHGDYHLGQVLRADGRWYVLDFEGEPARPMAERVAPASPLRDVAGMLRSFAYAAAVGQHPEAWEAACRGAFLDAYLATQGIGAILPVDPRPVLDAYELDKAIYEVAYERAHRPDWEAIPGAAVERLGGASGSGS
jgi:predicted trehalose synthase